MERITVSDGVLSTRGEPWRPWGFNYDRDNSKPSRLIEEYWDADWSRVQRDFTAMSAFGANVVRIHLSLCAFLDDAETARTNALDRLARLCDLAEEHNLWLDVTGAVAYRFAAQPGWLDTADEATRWRAQETFWSAVARRVADSPAIAWFGLVNEPIVPPEPVERWTAPGHFEDFEYRHYLVRDPAGRDRDEIGIAWTTRMRDAIREHDERPITIGFLPKAAPGCDPHVLAPLLDLVCMHEYPRADPIDGAFAGAGRNTKAVARAAGAVDIAASDAIANVRAMRVAGKPLVVEETFPLLCSPETMSSFMDGLRDDVDGWISFYWGDEPEGFVKSWQEQFAGLIHARGGS